MTTKAPVPGEAFMRIFNRRMSEYKFRPVSETLDEFKGSMILPPLDQRPDVAGCSPSELPPAPDEER